MLAIKSNILKKYSTSDFLLGVIVTFIYLWFYFKNAGRPDLLNNQMGWFGWWDQGQYYLSTRSFCNFDLSAKNHWYPIGYSVLAVPFCNLTENNPFFLVNLLCFILFYIYFYKLGKQYLNQYLVFSIFLFSLLLPYVLTVPHIQIVPLFIQFVYPWNSIPVAAIYAFVIYKSASNGVSLSGKESVVIGGIVGLLAFLRPVDVFPLVIPMLFLLYKISQENSSIKKFSFGCFGFIIIVVSFTLLTFLIHGSLISEYVEVSKNIGFNFFALGQRFYSLFIDSTTIYDSVENPLFRILPWLYVAIPLFFLWPIFDFKNAGPIVGAVLLSWVLYLAYNDLIPTNAFKYNVIHYVVWSFPYILLGAVIVLFDSIRSRKKFIFAMTLVIVFALAIGSIKLKYRTIKSTSPTVVGECASGVKLSYNNAGQKIDALRLINLNFRKDLDYNVEKIEMMIDGVLSKNFQNYRLIVNNGSLNVAFANSVSPDKIEICLDSIRFGGESIRIQPLSLKFGF